MADVPFCGVGELNQTVSVPVVREDPTPTRGVRRLRLAVETDYEFYQRFDDLGLAAAYVVALYGAVSDVYVRDVNTWLEIVFVRLWDTPDDLFNEFDPLYPFQAYWMENMGAVARDLATFLTGRRILPYGGVAYLDAVCSTSSGYSVT